MKKKINMNSKRLFPNNNDYSLDNNQLLINNINIFINKQFYLNRKYSYFNGGTSLIFRMLMMNIKNKTIILSKNSFFEFHDIIVKNFDYLYLENISNIKLYDTNKYILFLNYPDNYYLNDDYYNQLIENTNNMEIIIDGTYMWYLNYFYFKYLNDNRITILSSFSKIGYPNIRLGFISYSIYFKKIFDKYNFNNLFNITNDSLKIIDKSKNKIINNINYIKKIKSELNKYNIVMNNSNILLIKDTNIIDYLYKNNWTIRNKENDYYRIYIDNDKNKIKELLNYLKELKNGI